VREEEREIGKLRGIAGPEADGLLGRGGGRVIKRELSYG